jgi:chemotaxis protein methyltransferase CheR
MTPAERAFAARLAADRAGLSVDPEKGYLLESRLAPIARREGYASVDELLGALQGRGEEHLVWPVVEALGPAETSFFGDPATFEALRERILPALARARGGEPVRIWCAACGAGQEVYSLAMMLAETGVGPVELFASDISTRLLEKAQSGLYSQFEVQRGLSAHRLVRHFEKVDEMFAVAPQLRQQIRWRRVNLMDDITRLGRFEVVLCRNLLASRTAAARPTVLRNLAFAVRQGGALVLGPGDAVRDLPTLGLTPVEAAPGLFTRVPPLRAAA